MINTDWTEAERLWRSGAAIDEKLAMVERALAALAGGGPKNGADLKAAEGRETGRTK
jgi:hypothetical protein